MSGTGALCQGCQWLFPCAPMNTSASFEWDSDSSVAEPVVHSECHPLRGNIFRPRSSRVEPTHRRDLSKDQCRDAPLPLGPQLQSSSLMGRSRSAPSAKQASEFRRRNDRGGGGTNMVYSPSKKWPSPHSNTNKVHHHHQSNHTPNEEHMVVRVRTGPPLPPPPPMDAIFIPSPAPAAVGRSRSIKSVRFTKYDDYVPDEDPIEVYEAVRRSRSNRY